VVGIEEVHILSFTATVMSCSGSSGFSACKLERTEIRAFVLGFLVSMASFHDEMEWLLEIRKYKE
jgi:hypothetical protein